MFKQVTEIDKNALEAIVGKQWVSFKDEIHPDYTHDEMTQYGCYEPELVILPGCTKEVSKILSYCNENHICVTVRGAGTGLCGGCVAIEGGVVFSMM